MKRLYIAEKPSVGKAIAEHLPAPRKRIDGGIECADGSVVTWCFGHLFEQATPEDYDPAHKNWGFDTLPIVPTRWQLKPRESAQAQISIIGRLLKHCDEIVHAGDPDREGQLLVDEVLEHYENAKPVRRLWLSALDPVSVARALSELRDNAEFAPVKAAAEARQRADWLVGMNLTRAYTVAGRQAGYDGVLSVGRVQTPTLALVVRRDLQIENFVPAPYFVPVAHLRHANGPFTAVWQPQPDARGLDDSKRLIDAGIARAIAEKCHDKPVDMECKTVRAHQAAPLPFSLSALQKAASAKYGLSAQDVLDAAQSLYETHKATTYPRTDCRYLPESQHAAAAQILAGLPAEYLALSTGADPSLQTAAYNDKKITAHHAIVPTGARFELASLSTAERQIYDLVARAFLAQFYPAFEYDQTTVVVTIAGERFGRSGRAEVAAGWKTVYADPEDDEAKPASIPAMKSGDALANEGVRIEERATKAPDRYTDGTLIADMTAIHKYVDNEEIRKLLRDNAGIGTEATRAGIIETLLKRSFIAKKGKQLISTAAGRSLIAALPPKVSDPGITGLFEQALEGIAGGHVDAAAFLAKQVSFVSTLVATAKTTQLAIAPAVPATPCPVCGKALVKRKGAKGIFWSCSGYPDCKKSFDDKGGKPDITPSKPSFPRRAILPR